MRLAGAIVCALSIVLASAHADAIPAFARRTRTSCRTCHARSFPYLNAWGIRYRDNGYQLPDGAEDPVRAENMIEPGTVAERTSIFSTPPLAVRSRVLAEWAEDTDGENRLGVSVPYARLAAGGSLFQDVSLYLSADFAPAPALHTLTVGLHDVLPNGALSIVAGQLLLTPLQRSGHRSLTRLGNPIASVGVGNDPFRLEGDHVGVSLRGRPGWGMLSYEIAVANGARGATGQTGVGAPGALGRLLVTSGEHTVGLFGYAARARLRLDRGGIDREWDDRIAVAGLDAEVSLGRLLLYAAGLTGVHTDPRGDGVRVRYFGARAEALWAATDRLSFLGRFDAVDSGDDGTLRRRLVTLHAGHLILTSLRGSVEGTIDLIPPNTTHTTETRLLAFLEVAL